jgi:hypothetical protein
LSQTTIEHLELDVDQGRVGEPVHPTITVVHRAIRVHEPNTSDQYLSQGKKLLF